MNIRRSMKYLGVFGVLTFWSATAMASPISVDFEIGGFADGGELSGSFTGDDRDANGYLRQFLFLGELSSFTVSWSGNSTTDPFSHDYGDLRWLNYSLVDSTLLSFHSGCLFFCGNRTSAGLSTVAYVDGLHRWDGQRTRSPSVTATTVSEPGALGLFGIGLLAAGFVVRRRRVRSST